MSDFFEDNWCYFLFLLLLLFGLILSIHYINTQNSERLAIINNNKKNVVKYDFNHCQFIDDYYYCWND